MHDSPVEADPPVDQAYAEWLRFSLLEWIDLQTFSHGPLVEVRKAMWQFATSREVVATAVEWLQEAGYVECRGAGPTVSITEAGREALERYQEGRTLPDSR